jgi:hypothetical protein
MFVSPPPRVEWPQGADPTAQTSVEIEDEDVDWAVVGAGEEAGDKAAGKRPAAPKQSKKRSVTTLLTGGALNINEPEDPEENSVSKHRQMISAWANDDAEEGEDADTFRLVPRKRRKQLESMEQGGSSTPVGPTSPMAVKDAAGSTSGVPGQGT